MSRYWKFLRPGAVGPYSGHRWATGTTGWTTAVPVRGCLTGIHACRERDLAYWLTEELWQIELAGDVAELADKVMAPRGRLVRRVSAWTGAAAGEFALACLARTMGHAVAELRDADLPAAAERLATAGQRLPTAGHRGADAPAGLLATVARDLAAAATGSGHRRAAVLCGYVADAVDCVVGQPVASTAYVAARAANQRSDPPGTDPYLDERAWQCRWLAGRLALAEFPAGGE